MLPFPTSNCLESCLRPTVLGPARRFRARTAGGFTLIETGVAAALITLFLSSLFLLNSTVLRMLRSGNETANASQLLQARAEQIRMSNWLDVTAASYVPKTLLARQPGMAINLSTLTETVSVGAYQYNPAPGAMQAAPSYIYQLAPNGTTITSQGGSGVALGGSDCVQFTITEHWTSWGGRARERTLITLASTWGIGQR